MIDALASLVLAVPPPGILQERSAHATGFKGLVSAVNAALSRHVEFARFSILGASATVRHIHGQPCGIATEIVGKVPTPTGLVEFCSRYPWEMDEREAAVWFRGSMQRHQAVRP